MAQTRPIRFVAAATALVALVAGGLADYATIDPSGYTVRRGDTLWAIATSRGLTVAQLASANSFDPASILPIGRHLRIPARGQASTSSSGSSSGRVSSGGASSGANPAIPAPLAVRYDPRTFCRQFVATPGPHRVLPAKLVQSPDRLALRPIFQKWSRYYNVALPLLEAVDWQESGWQENVVSYTGAVGIGQIEPTTGAFIANVLIGAPTNAAVASDNIRMSAAFLSYLAGVEGNDRCATIAAYYEGPLNMAAYGVFPSTQGYVSSVEGLINRFA